MLEKKTYFTELIYFFTENLSGKVNEELLRKKSKATNLNVSAYEPRIILERLNI